MDMSVTDMTVKNCISFSNRQNALNSATTIDIVKSRLKRALLSHFSLSRTKVNAPHVVDRRLFCTNNNPNLVSFSPLPVLRWEACSYLGSFWFAKHGTFSFIGMWLNSKTESFFLKKLVLWLREINFYFLWKDIFLIINAENASALCVACLG